MAKRKGRKAGSHNKGYFYRSGRGWCTSQGTRAIPLTREDGSRLRDRNTPPETIKEAFARYVVSQKDAVRFDGKVDVVTLAEVCQLYLSHCQATNAAGTYLMRADTLFDLCTGLPAKFREKQPTKDEIEKERIHSGYGKKQAAELLPLDIDQWGCQTS